MRLKRNKGIGLIELVISVSLLAVLGFLFTKWNKKVSTSVSNTEQKINLTGADKNITLYWDCCATYKGYFGGAYPGNIPLNDSMFTAPVTMRDKSGNDINIVMRPWEVQAVPGGEALLVQYRELRPQKNYVERDISSFQSRRDLSSMEERKGCQYGINHCVSNPTGGSTSTGGSTGGSTSSGTTSTSSGTSTGAGTATGTGTATSTGTSTGTTTGTGSSTGSFTGGSSTASVTGSTTGTTTGTSTTSVSGTTTGTTGTGSGTATSSSTGPGCYGGDVVCPPCGSIVCGGRNNFNLICPAMACEIAIDQTTPINIQTCLQTACGASGTHTCECDYFNMRMCYESAAFAAATSCNDGETAACHLNCLHLLQQKAIECAQCCSQYPTPCTPRNASCPCPP